MVIVMVMVMVIVIEILILIIEIAIGISTEHKINIYTTAYVITTPTITTNTIQEF